ncbi:YbgI/family dinuclear metal center protein [Cryptococcus neoformans]|uniref:YbgI/family dinuclear metal center protein n=1 Tax=Cryptococcus neoformans Tu259-1 TaxID=1230072 RepID=A0A854QKB0_CRYNE|nr:YbgI/family dinuclear metal center protein [Cryptococcus neoformans var. grubii AD1-83a]OWZ49759.1 YbgI/family dinuclear metal center protein [Cryptococcus neoformans var. grubii 125.91]OWZ65257.1 YbgI/family dinuclear metal center protein [Cryptococcus neoformans var. grubii]OWZ74665.1 YbgI/family dinuclear metal center protein [Cryptococcus neoformans var. grubii Bt85]OXG09826.1 YbgI/family dinuclear metal center protein [Cryptococcus neoformans var. grubii Ze90-1]OXG24183.1 YbgI/family d
MGGSPQITPLALIKRVWERIAPLQLAERSWDNVGPIIEAPYPNPSHRQVLLTIDLTPSVCAEALKHPSLSLIISYHPPIFRGLKSLTLSDPLQASLLKLSAKGISVFAPHTSLDATPNGINTWLIRPFIPLSISHDPIIPSDPLESFEGAGMGRIAKLSEPLDTRQAIKMVKDHLRLDFVQLAEPQPDVRKPIKSVAVCAGSGGSVFKGVEADLLITGEMSHHEILAYVASGTTVILTNHTNTERPYLSHVLRPWLQEELNKETKDQGDEYGANGGKWEVLVSKADADPLRVV